MVDVVDSTGAGADTPDEARPRRAVPSWVITAGSLIVLLGAWEIFGRDINPVFGSYPSAIAEAAWQLARTGKLWTALLDSLRPFFLGYGLAIVIGVPVGLITGRFRTVEAAIGIYITAGYAMPLVALVPLLVLWLGLGFAVKVAVVFLMSVFPICINTWLGVTAVPKTLIEVGKSFVAPNAVILRRIILPATLPYIMAGIRLAVGRAVVAMVIAEFFTSISGLGAIIITSANNFDTAHNVCADSCTDDNGSRAQLPDRGGRAPGRAVAGGDRRAGRIAAGVTSAGRGNRRARRNPRP
jgi:NitT/TauT family transport system permease protein